MSASPQPRILRNRWGSLEPPATGTCANFCTTGPSDRVNFRLTGVAATDVRSYWQSYLPMAKRCATPLIWAAPTMKRSVEV